MWQKRFIEELNSKYLKFMFKDPKNKDYPKNKPEETMIELMVRPIEIYEVVFPKECYDLVATTVFGKDKTAGAVAYPKDKMKLASYAMRKMLGAKKLPDWKTDNFMPITKNGLSILGIGIREDKQWEYGEGL